MLINKTKLLSTLLSCCLLGTISVANAGEVNSIPSRFTLAPNDPLGQNFYDQNRLSMLYYYGYTVDASLLQVLTLQNMKRWPEDIQSFEVAYTLSQDNFLRQLVNPIVGVVQLAGNVTLRNGKGEPRIFEFDPYIIFRWANLPWNHYVMTSFGFAEGVSYTTSVPAMEKRYSDHTKRFLNYLMFEATFALPQYPRFQVVARVHHRSGAYGLYHAGNTGTNDIGLGIRYFFD